MSSPSGPTTKGDFAQAANPSPKGMIPTRRQILSGKAKSFSSLSPASSPPKRFLISTPMPVLHTRLMWASVKSQPRHAAGQHWFTVDRVLNYQPFCADFGPMNLACVARFNALVREKLQSEELGTGSPPR
jgi:hypothetical protein